MPGLVGNKESGRLSFAFRSQATWGKRSEHENAEKKDGFQKCYMGRKTVQKRKHKQKYGGVCSACVFGLTVMYINGELEEISNKAGKVA